MATVIIDNTVLADIGKISVITGDLNLNTLINPNDKMVITSTVYGEATTDPTNFKKDQIVKNWLDAGIASGRIQEISTPAFPVGPKNSGDNSILSILPAQLVAANGGVIVLTDDGGLTTQVKAINNSNLTTNGAYQYLFHNWISGAISYIEYAVTSYQLASLGLVNPGTIVEPGATAQGLNNTSITVGQKSGVITVTSASGAKYDLSFTDRFTIDSNGVVHVQSMPPLCFAEGTLINMANGSVRRIEDIKVGDIVLAFDNSVGLSELNFVPRQVTRLFRNQTTEWLSLSNGTVVTPGHFFLNEVGKFEQIQHIIRRGGSIVSVGGSLEKVSARSIRLESSNLHLFELIQHSIVDGSNALNIEAQLAWKTYNFEVEELHTYIANGYRVHNDSLGDLISAESQYANLFGAPFDPSDPSAIQKLAGAIANGSIIGGDLTTSIGTDGDLSALEERIQADNDKISDTLSDGEGDVTFTDSLGDKITLNQNGKEIQETIVDGQGGLITKTFGYSANGTQYISEEDDYNSGGTLTSSTKNIVDPNSGSRISTTIQTLNPDGSLTTEHDIYDASGSIVYDEIDTSDPASGIEIYVDGTGDQVIASSVTVHLSDDASATIIGGQNQIGAASGSSITIDGSNNSASVIAGSIIDNGKNNIDSVKGGRGSITYFSADGLASSQITYDATGHATLTTFTYDESGNQIAHDEGSYVSEDGSPSLANTGIPAQELINDLALQAGDGDPSQLFSDSSTSSNPILIWDTSAANTTPSGDPSAAGSLVTLSGLSFTDFDTELEGSTTSSHNSAGSGFIPTYENDPTSDAPSYGSPVFNSSGTLVLPSENEAPEDAIFDLVNELNETYPGNIYIIGSNDQPYTPAQFESLSSYTGSYGVYFADKYDTGTNYYSMFNIDPALNLIESTSGNVQQYESDPSNPPLSTSDLISETYSDNVEPYLGDYVPPGSTSADAAYIDTFLDLIDSIYTGNIFITSASGQTYTIDQFKDLSSFTGSYSINFHDIDGETYPLFEMNPTYNLIASDSGTVQQYLNDPSNPRLTNEELIEATYDNIVGHEYDGPSEAGQTGSHYLDYDTTALSADLGALGSLLPHEYAYDWFNTYAPLSDGYYTQFGEVFTSDPFDPGYFWHGSGGGLGGLGGGGGGDLGGGDDGGDEGGGDDGGDEGDDEPLVLNLTGGQVHTTGIHNANMTFDVFGDGEKASTGWIRSGEGFLVFDPLNVTVTNGSQFVPSFGDLASFDTNGDGVLSAREADAAGIKVWIDTNGDGLGTPDELYSLSALGIASINLNAALTGTYDNGNLIAADSTFTWATGQEGDIADVYLANGTVPDIDTAYVTPNGTTTVSTDGTVTEILTGSNLAIDIAASGVNTLIDRGTGNVFTGEGSQNGVIIGGVDSTLIAGDATGLVMTGGLNSKLYGGSGSDELIALGDSETIKTGTGSNTVEVDSNDNAIDASEGTVALTIAGNGNTVHGGANQTLSVEVDGTDDYLAVNSDVITLDAGSQTTLDGGENNLSGSSASLTLEGVGSSNSATLTDSTVTMTAGVSADPISLALTGDDNTVTEAGYDTLSVDSTSIGTAVQVSGSHNVASVSNGTLTLAGASPANTVNLSLSGSGNTIAASGNVILTGAAEESTLNVSGSNNNLTANDSTFNLADGSSANVSGNSNTISGSGTAAVNVYGTGQVITLSNSTIAFGDDATATINGDNDSIIEGTGDAVSVVGTGSSLTVSGAGNEASLSNGTVAFKAGTATNQFSLDLIGNSDTVTATSYDTLTADPSDTGIVLQVSGANNDATLSNGAISLVGTTTNYATLVLTGSNDTVTQSNADLFGTATEITDSVSGGYNNVDASESSIALAGATTAFVSGNDNAITGAGSDTLTVGGTGNTITLSNSTLSLGVSSSDTVDGDEVVATETGGGTLTLTGANEQLIVFGASNSATLSDGQITFDAGTATAQFSLYLTGNGDSVTETSYDTFTADPTDSDISLGVTGTHNSASLSNGAISLTGTATTYATLTLSGSGDTVTQSYGILSGTATGITDNVSGSYNGITATNSTINVAEGTTSSQVQATVSGSGDVISQTGYSTITDGTTATSVTISGIGNIDTLASATVTLASGAAATINGNGNTITSPGSVTLTLAGSSEVADVSGGTISISSGSGTVINGDNDVVYDLSNDPMTINGSNETVFITQSGTVTAITGNNISIDGTGGLSYTAEPFTSIAGTSNTQTLSDYTISMSKGTSSAYVGLTLSGNDDTVTEQGYDKLTVNSASTGIGVNVSGTSNYVTMTGGRVTLASAAGLALTGNNDSVMALGSGNTLTASGTGDTITMSSGTTTLSTAAAATVIGNSNSITADGSDTIVVSGTGNTLHAIGSGNTATMSNGTAAMNGGTSSSVYSLTLTGDSDSVTQVGYDTLIANVNDTGLNLHVIGTGNTATLSNGTVALAGTSASTVSLALSGSNNTITQAYATLSGTASGSTDTVSGTNNTVYLSSSTINLASSSTGNIWGSGDTVSGSSTGLWRIYGSGTLANFTSSSVTLGTVGSALSLAGDSNTITLSGTDTLSLTGANEVVDVGGSGNVVTMAGGTLALNGGTSTTALNGVTFYGNNVSATEAGYDTITSDEGNTGTTLHVIKTGNSATLYNATVTLAGTSASAAGLSLSGDSVTVTQSGYDTLTGAATNVVDNVSGVSNAITLTGGTINLSSSSSGTISGNNNLVSGTATATWTINGTGTVADLSSSTITIGAGANVTINGASDTISEIGTGTATVSGSNATLKVSGASNTATVTAATITINAGTSTAQNSLSLTGNNDSATEAGYDTLTSDPANTGLTLQVTGTHNIVTASNANVTLTGVSASNYAALTLTGSNDIVTQSNAQLTGSGTGIVDDVRGGTYNNITLSNSTVNIAAGTSSAQVQVTLTGNTDAITQAGYSTLTSSGTGFQDTITGTGNSDTVSSSSLTLLSGAVATVSGSNDTIDLTNNATVTATGTGEDYQFGIGGGQSEIKSTSGTNKGEVDLGSGITDQDVWLQQVGNNLQIDLLGTNDHLTIDNWFGGSSSAGVQSIDTGDGLKIDSQINQLVSTMAAYTAANPGFNPTTATQMPSDSTLQTTIAASYH